MPEALAPHAAGPLPLRLKLRLVREVLGDLRRVRRRLGRADVRDLVAEVRAGAAQGATATPPERRLHDAARLARVVVRVLRPVPGDTSCLRRSLVLAAVLERRGIPQRVVIGVRPGGTADFGAHAWVEVDGRPVLDPGGFARLVEL